MISKIPLTHINEFIGQMVHVSWANPGCVWYLTKINNKSAILRAPTSGKTLIVNVDELQSTHNNKELLKPWFVYLVRCSDNSLYTGISTDVEQRIKVHNSGKGARYTKSRRPVVLIKFFECLTKSEALKLEYKIKQLSREEKLIFDYVKENK